MILPLDEHHLGGKWPRFSRIASVRKVPLGVISPILVRFHQIMLQ